MAIKLIKACKELNIGMATLTAWCEKHGYSIDHDPNIRIDDELYLRLAREFNNNKYMELAGNVEEELPNEPSSGTDMPRMIRLDRACREFMKMKDLVPLLHERGIDVPYDKEHLLTLDEYEVARDIYLHSPKAQNLLNTIPDDIDPDTLKQIWTAHTDVQEKILELLSAPVKIDPTSIAISGDKLYVQAAQDSHAESVIEQIAQILNTQISEHNLQDGYVEADPGVVDSITDTQKKEIIEQASANHIDFSFRPMVDGYIRSRTTNVAKFHDLLRQLNIQPLRDRQDRMLMTIDELNALKEAIKENHDVDVPTQASAIINISVSPIFALQKDYPFVRFGKQYYHSTRKDKDAEGNTIKKQTFYHHLIVYNGFFNEEEAQRVFDLYGMKLTQVKFHFHLKPEAIFSYDWKKNESRVPKPNEDGDIIYNRNLIYSRDPFDEEDEELSAEATEMSQPEESDIPKVRELQYDRVLQNAAKMGIDQARWKKYYNRVFGENMYTLEVEYIYSYSKKRTWLTPELQTEFVENLRAYLASANVTVSNNSKSVGIDFDWTEEDLYHIVRRLNTEYPCIEFDIFPNHRCKVDIQVSDLYLRETVNQLQERFEGIQVEPCDSKQQLHFYKECDNIEQEKQTRDLLTREVRGLSNDKVDIELCRIPSHTIKLRLNDNVDARREEGLERIAELRGADFNADTQYIGRLVSVKDYPNLVFDISGDEYDKVVDLMSNFQDEFLQPNLIGDREKVARLKESLKSIISGKGIQNPNLSYFIFDASTLKVDPILWKEMMNIQLQEIEKHILNSSINESQKKAIAKSLVAQDLALIQGPPGTGKSTAIAEIIWQHVRENPTGRILLTSETNLAVDNAIARVLNPHHNLVKPIRIGAQSRLESEGRQFALDVLQKWAGITEMEKKSGLEDEFEIGDALDDIDNEEDDFETEEINGLPANENPDAPLRELNVLEKWLRNIANRADDSRMAPDTLAHWHEAMQAPDANLRSATYDAYVHHCNVIGATCSSIGKENTVLTKMLEQKFGANSGIALCAFYKAYQQIYGSQKMVPLTGKTKWSQPPIEFDVVIQDESSKATPAELSLPLIYGRKNIIIGDHRQLPPMLSKEDFEQSFDFLIQHEADDKERTRLVELKSFVKRNFKKLEVSQFERLFHDIPRHLKGVFNTQYRMHPAINEVIKQFYVSDGGLDCGLTQESPQAADNPNMHHPCSRYHGINIPGLITEQDHVLWIDTKSPEMLDGTSRINFGEVEVIEKILRRLAQSDSYKHYLQEWSELEDKQIGLISFYGKQLRLLRDVCKSIPEVPIRVSTVDRFQGMERNIVIVSMVRSNCITLDKDAAPDFKRYPDYGYMEQPSLGFADSPNRLNVALSRAKRLLIIVGNSEHFRRHPIYDNVYKTITLPYGRIIKAEEL